MEIFQDMQNYPGYAKLSWIWRLNIIYYTVQPSVEEFYYYKSYKL